jgi:YVTN family beta-propeller protein
MIIDVNDDDFIALASSSIDALHPKTHNFNQTKQYTPHLMIIFTPCPPNLTKYFKRGCINRFMMMGKMAKRSRSIVMIAVSIAILLLALGLPVTANGPQNSGQNNPGGYVKYTLDLIHNTLIDGNVVNIGNSREPLGIAYNPSNGYIYVANYFSGTVSIISTSISTSSASISSVTTPATSTSTTPTPSVEPTWVVGVVVVVVVLIIALMIKHRKP